MAAITIRNLLQQASNSSQNNELKIMDIATEYFGASNGVDLELPKRSTHRKIVEF